MAAFWNKLQSISVLISRSISGYSSQILSKRTAATHSAYPSLRSKCNFRSKFIKLSSFTAQQGPSPLTMNYQVANISYRPLFSYQSPCSTFYPNLQVPIITKNRSFPTLHQLLRGKRRTKKHKKKVIVAKENKILQGPQRKGVCVKVFIRKPKKPNSANRKCALLRLNNGQTIIAYIPGEKASLQEHGVVLFEGGRVQDCPGVRYKIVRGKYDVN